MKRFFIIFFLVLIVANISFSADFIDGRIRLVLNPNNGRFSLYYMSDIAHEEFSPLFTSVDPRTSFLSLIMNNRSYKLGESSAFKTSIGGNSSSPSLIFESAFLVITQNFTFIRTGSSSLTNGVLITITLTNKGAQTINAGIRLLIDTDLGEKSQPHFITQFRAINSETIIASSSTEQYWVSQNGKLALVGSIASDSPPDVVHFANWKRLNDAPWKIPYMAGRNFNLLPYSIDDSAVCYYFEPEPIAKDAERVAIISLSGTAPGEYGNIFAISNSAAPEPAVVLPAPENNGTGIHAASGSEITEANVIAAAENTVSMEISRPNSMLAAEIMADLEALQELISHLDESIVSGASISDEELAAISLLIYRIKLKYSIP